MGWEASGRLHVASLGPVELQHGPWQWVPSAPHPRPRLQASLVLREPFASGFPGGVVVSAEAEERPVRPGGREEEGL